jgi:lambda family phage portal protein
MLPDYAREEENEESGELSCYEDIKPGTVMYGNRNEKPHILESSRPSPNFASFSEFVLRAMAASLDMPYEVLAKDFSKTNYSSARAALLEAWRVFTLYRSWLTRHYCQPIWSMVIEEAWLSGLLKFPSGAPDFYDAQSLYTKALWIGPSRGYVDPVKEIGAIVTALENRLTTYSEALAETGRDFDETMDEREEEEIRLAKFTPQPTKPSTFKEQKEANNASV